MAMKELLAHLAKHLKLKELKLDDQGRCNLELNDTHLLSLERSLIQGQFWLYSVVVEVSEQEQSLLLRLAMEGNLFQQETGKAVLGYHIGTRLLVLCQSFQENELSPVQFVEAFSQFVVVLGHWKEKLSPERVAEARLHDLKKQTTALSPSQIKIFFA